MSAMSKDHYPMLAKPVEWDKIVYPCIVQPKLDGVRCIAIVQEDGSVHLRSRDDKPLYMDKIKQAVEQLGLPVGTMLDGELYAHGVDFNKLSGDVRREVQDARKDYIQYWVYDVMRGPEYDGTPIHQRPYYNTDDEQSSRYDWLSLQIADHRPDDAPFTVVDSYFVQDEGEVKSFSQSFEAHGFEGAMIRCATRSKPTKKNPDGIITQDFYQAAFYGHSRRSNFLMKVKTFQDAEAVIVDIEEEVDLSGVPKNRTGKFVMQTPEGIRFRASGLTDEMKADSWATPSKYIGQTATYKHFGVSEGNVPRHPTFKALRPIGQIDEAV